MWTPQNRRRYDRSQLRYPSDLTDDEWAHVAPLNFLRSTRSEPFAHLAIAFREKDGNRRQ